MAQERIGQRLGRYELRYLVAQGGMASVYLAQLAGSHEFQRWVAIKVMHKHLAEEEAGFIEMFLDEARLAARIQHPNVCQVIDFGEQDGTYYIVMEYLHGETLSMLVKRSWKEAGSLSPVLAATIGANIARGLHAAHELRGRDRQLLNLVHRDVSPQNMIVLYDGMAKITDFGIARARGRLSSTQAGTVKGKFAYMAPEHLNIEDVDRRADVWSLGVCLWEATLGRHLFRSPSDGETALKVVEGPIPRPSELVAGYPGELDDIIMGALQRDPDRRIPTAEALATKLEEFTRAQKYEHWGPAEVAEYVANLFPDKLRQREEMLSADSMDLDDGVTMVDLHSSSSSTFSSGVQPIEKDLASLEIDISDVPSDPPEPVASPPARPWWAFPAIGAGLVVGLGLGALMFFLLAGPRGDRAQLPTVPPGASASIAPQGAGAATDEEPEETSEPEAAAEEETVAEEGAAADEGAADEESAAEGEGAPEGESASDDEATGAEPAEEDGASEEEAADQGATEVAAAAPADEPEEEPAAERTPASPREDPPRRRRSGRSSSSRPQPTGSGTLNLLAIPRAEVRWHGRVIGQTPLINYEMPAGRHRLVLRATDGSGRRAVRVTIRNGQRTSQSVNLSQ